MTIHEGTIEHIVDTDGDWFKIIYENNIVCKFINDGIHKKGIMDAIFKFIHEYAAARGQTINFAMDTYTTNYYAESIQESGGAVDEEQITWFEAITILFTSTMIIYGIVEFISWLIKG